MATYYAPKSELARAVHVSRNTMVSKFTWTATASVGDVINMCRLPSGCTVVEAAVYGTGADMYDYGTASSGNRFYDSTSAVTTLHKTNTAVGTGYGYHYSGTSSDAVMSEYVTLTVLVADSSVGDITTVVVEYVMD